VVLAGSLSLRPSAWKAQELVVPPHLGRLALPLLPVTTAVPLPVDTTLDPAPAAQPAAGSGGGGGGDQAGGTGVAGAASPRLPGQQQQQQPPGGDAQGALQHAPAAAGVDDAAAAAAGGGSEEVLRVLPALPALGSLVPVVAVGINDLVLPEPGEWIAFKVLGLVVVQVGVVGPPEACWGEQCLHHADILLLYTPWRQTAEWPDVKCSWLLLQHAGELAMCTTAVQGQVQLVFGRGCSSMAAMVAPSRVQAAQQAVAGRAAHNLTAQHLVLPQVLATNNSSGGGCRDAAASAAASSGRGQGGAGSCAAGSDGAPLALGSTQLLQLLLPSQPPCCGRRLAVIGPSPSPAAGSSHAPPDRALEEFATLRAVLWQVAQCVEARLTGGTAAPVAGSSSSSGSRSKGCIGKWRCRVRITE
jgi:hypothetical protein